MARKASNSGLVCTTKWPPYHMFNVKWGYAIRRPYISLTIAPRVWDVKTISSKSRPGNVSQLLNLTFDPCFKVKWGHHTIIISARASECKNSPWEAMVCKSFAGE